jgi:two-component system OmpR family sensor kinase
LASLRTAPRRGPLRRWLLRRSTALRVSIVCILASAITLTFALLLVRGLAAGLLADGDVALARDDLEVVSGQVEADGQADIAEAAQGLLIYAQDPDGAVQANSLPSTVFDSIAAEQPSVPYRLTDAQGQTFVVVSEPVVTKRGTWSVWAAHNTAASKQASEVLDRALLLAGILLTALFGIGAWVLAKLALRPLLQVQRRARDHTGSSSKSHRRRAPSEVEPLAQTLDALAQGQRAHGRGAGELSAEVAQVLTNALPSLTSTLAFAGSAMTPAVASQQIGLASRQVTRISADITNLLDLHRLREPSSAEVGTTSAFVEQLMDTVDRFRQSNGSSIIDFGTTGAEADYHYALSSGRFRRLLEVLLEVATEARLDSAFVAIQQNATGITISLYSASASDADIAELHPLTSSAEVRLALASALVGAAGGTFEAHQKGAGWAVEVTIPAVGTATNPTTHDGDQSGA